MVWDLTLGLQPVTLFFWLCSAPRLSHFLGSSLVGKIPCVVP